MQTGGVSSNKKTLEEIANFAKNYGFFYPAGEIYGGKTGFYDYGSLGTLLKRKFEDLWRKHFLNLFDNIWEIEPTNIMHEKVFIASKHLELFNDPITECKNGHRFRADKLIEEKLGIKADSLSIEEMNKIFEEKKVVCPICGESLSKIRMFNLMFPIFVGPESGDLYMYLNELYNDFTKKENILKQIKSKKPTFITEDGVEFAAILKEFFYNQELYYFEEDGIFYLFTKDLKRIMELDIFTREAKFYLPKNISIDELLKKYDNIDPEKTFEEVLKKTKNYLKYIDNENYLLEKIYESYRHSIKNRMFLRPETAQGPYINFPIEIKIHRNKLPLGLAVIGKAYRNEISPRNLLLRLREFTQAELQIFFDYEYWLKNFNKEFDWENVKSKKVNVLLVRDREKSSCREIALEELEKYGYPKFYLYFIYKVWEFYIDKLKIPKERLRFYELDENEKSFYNKYHFDVEVFLDDLGWVEVGGIHFRTIEISREDIQNISNKKIKKYLESLLADKDKVIVGYDIYNHFVYSEDTSFVITKKDGKKILPVELELSFGVDRNIFALLWVFYTKEKVNNEERIVLKLPIYLSPIEVAVFPLLENKKELVDKAKDVYTLLKTDFKAFFDSSGSIGKRYRRQDAIGTPFCITIDYQTLKDDTVTIRFRDTMKQIRVSIKDLKKKLRELFSTF